MANSKTVGYIGADGRYVRGEDKPMADNSNSISKEYNRDIERKLFSKEILQPRVNGKASPEFVRAYPGYSKKYFSQAEIDEATRRLS